VKLSRFLSVYLEEEDEVERLFRKHCDVENGCLNLTSFKEVHAKILSSRLPFKH
jgi:hypothetical protein